MKLKDLLNVLLCHYKISVNNGIELIEEFGDDQPFKAVKYKYAPVTSVHVLNEDTVAINVDVKYLKTT